MFETYLEDAYLFLDMAKQQLEEDNARRYFRASIFCLASAVEAFVNYLIDAFSEADVEVLSVEEKIFLGGVKFNFSETQGLKRKADDTDLPIYPRLGFLLYKFVPNFDFSKNNEWKNFIKIKKLRNDLIHPKQDSDETSVVDYASILKGGLTDIIILINMICEGAFGRPLRKQVLDLIPE